MTSSFKSFQKSPLGVFVRSPLGVRNSLGELVFAANFFYDSNALSATITAGGTGYTIEDDLTVLGGTGTAATFNVDAVSSGVVTAVSVISGGSYSVEPTNPASTSGGTGTGCTLTITYSDKDIFDVGFLSTDLAKIGENEGFNLNTAPMDVQKIFGFKKNLYVTGNMTKNIASTRTYSGIAQLNTTEGIWEILAGTDLNFSGLGGQDMCAYKGNLIIVGAFTNANGVANTSKIAGWDETTYFNIGVFSPIVAGTILSCTVYQGDLWAGGFFTEILDSSPIAKFDGTDWSIDPVGAGDPTGFNPDVMLQHKTSLICGGITQLWEWTGTAWNQISITVNRAVFQGRITGMTIFKGDLILSGNFATINGTAFNNVVKWDGTNLSTLGTGLGDDDTHAVDDVHVLKGKLYGIGTFKKNGDGDDVVGLAIFNEEDEKWEQAGSNTDLTTNFASSLSTFTGKLTGQITT